MHPGANAFGYMGPGPWGPTFTGGAGRDQDSAAGRDIPYGG
jgi:hypothetical protein